MPIWQFSRNRLIGWIGHALLVQPSKTAHRIFFFLFYTLIFIYFIKYETIVRSSTWSFGHLDPDPSSVFSDWHSSRFCCKCILFTTKNEFLSLNPKKTWLLGGVFGENWSFSFLTSLSNKAQSISCESWDVLLTFDTLVNVFRFKL